MRYIVVCPQGHMGDFPWKWWAHRSASGREQEQCQSKDLEFRVDPGRGVGLAALFVGCLTCGSENNLTHVATDQTSKAVMCPGKQPWQAQQDAERCGADIAVLNLGATNTYFAQTVSALDLPPESRYISEQGGIGLVIADPRFGVVMSGPQGPVAQLLIGQLAATHGVSVQAIQQAVVVQTNKVSGTTRHRTEFTSEIDLRAAEWKALLEPEAEQDPRDKFVSHRTQLFDAGETIDSLDSLVSGVVALDRLREVRVLRSFSRYDLEDGAEVPVDLGQDVGWLPAIEMFGEGIFLTLNEDAVSAFESQPAVVQRVALLESRASAAFFRTDKPVDGRFLLLHTLSHLLLRRISFGSGYPATALKERVYADPGQAGILVYAAEAGANGTLGGLVRLAEPPRFAEIVVRAIEDSVWCSADPVCRESTGQGYGGLNLAACHACALVSETSCDHRNMFLDREAVVSGSGTSTGFFDGVLTEILESGA